MGMCAGPRGNLFWHSWSKWKDLRTFTLRAIQTDGEKHIVDQGLEQERVCLRCNKKERRMVSIQL